MSVVPVHHGYGTPYHLGPPMMLFLLNPHESGRGFDDGDHDDDDDDRVYDHHHDGLALGDFVTPLFLSLQDFSREREREREKWKERASSVFCFSCLASSSSSSSRCSTSPTRRPTRRSYSTAPPHGAPPRTAS